MRIVAYLPTFGTVPVIPSCPSFLVGQAGLKTLTVAVANLANL